MAGHRKFADIRSKDMSPERERRRANARAKLAAEIAAYEATLAQLRRARGLTQQQLAKALELSQPEISKVERRTDVLLSTLRSYVEALGGDLHVVAQFPDQEPVALSFDELLEGARGNRDALP